MGNALIKFINDMEAIVRSHLTESETLRHSKALLENFLRYSEPVPQEAFMARGDRNADNLIYMPEDKSFSIVGSVWLPGQITPVHDHLTWAVIGIYEGEEREEIYRRTDASSSPTTAKVKKVNERINRKGQVNVLATTGIHRIENVSQRASLSLHVYGLDIGNTKRHTYDPATGEIGVFLTGYHHILNDLR